MIKRSPQEIADFFGGGYMAKNMDRSSARSPRIIREKSANEEE